MWPFLLGKAADYAVQGISQQHANTFNREQAEAQREWSGQEAQKQRQWAELQTDTNRRWASQEAGRAFTRQTHAMKNQVQWQVKDLKAAGLNPLLAVGKASPSAPGSTGMPAGMSPGSSAGAGAQAVGRSVLANAGSAMEAGRFFREVKATNSQIAVNKALEKKAQMEARTAENSAKGIDLNNQVRSANLPAQLKHAEINKDWAKYDAVLKRIQGTASSAKSIAPIIKGGLK